MSRMIQVRCGEDPDRPPDQATTPVDADGASIRRVSSSLRRIGASGDLRQAGGWAVQSSVGVATRAGLADAGLGARRGCLRLVGC
jgi:hypothetical protein